MRQLSLAEPPPVELAGSFSLSRSREEGLPRDHSSEEEDEEVTVWYNFVKMPKTLKMTPALAANVSDTLCSMDDLVALVDAHDAAEPCQKPGRKPKAQ